MFFLGTSDHHFSSITFEDNYVMLGDPEWLSPHGFSAVIQIAQAHPEMTNTSTIEQMHIRRNVLEALNPTHENTWGFVLHICADAPPQFPSPYQGWSEVSIRNVDMTDNEFHWRNDREIIVSTVSSQDAFDWNTVGYNYRLNQAGDAWDSAPFTGVGVVGGFTTPFSF
jgi:hypothetical protein